MKKLEDIQMLRHHTSNHTNVALACPSGEEKEDQNPHGGDFVM